MGIRLGVGIGLRFGGAVAAWTPEGATGLLRWHRARSLSDLAATSGGSGAVANGDPAGWMCDLSAAADPLVQATSGRRPIAHTHARGRGVALYGSGGLGSGGNYLAGSSAVAGARHAIAAGLVVGPNSTRGAGADPSPVFLDGYHGLLGLAPVSDGALFLSGENASPSNEWRTSPPGITTYERNGVSVSVSAANVGYGRTWYVWRVSKSSDATAGALNVLRHVGYDGFYWRGAIGEAVLFSSAVSSDDLTRTFAYLSDYWLSGPLVAITGDSLAAGYDLLESEGPAALVSEAYGRTISTPSIAIPGQGVGSSISPITSTLITTDAAKLAALKGVHRPAVVVALCGTNDLANGRTSAQLLADVQTYAAAVRAAGWRVVVATVAPRTKDTYDAAWPSGKEAERVAYNTAVRGGWSSWADGLLDADLLAPALAADGIHWTAAGTAAAITGAGGLTSVLAGLV